MGITVTKVRDTYGIEFSGVCTCGAKVGSYVERGAQVSQVPGPFPGDIECEECGRWYNSNGQEIRPRGEFDREVDRWDEDY